MPSSYLTAIQTTDDLANKLKKFEVVVDYVCGIVLTRPNDARNVLLEMLKEMKSDGFVSN